MAELFVQQAIEYTGLLEQACKAMDKEQWCSVAHQMKGMASFAGAERLQSVCSYAEKNEGCIFQSDHSVLHNIQVEADLAIAEFNLYIQEAREC